MDPELARKAQDIVGEALEELSRPPGPAAQYFFVVSRSTRFIVNVALSPAPSVDLDELLLGIYEFLESQSSLEDGNIYLTRLGETSILMEPFRGAVLAEAFNGAVDRQRYKDFHRAVRQIQKSFPELGPWDGRPQSLPSDFRSRLHSCLGPAAPAARPPAAGPGPPAAPAEAPRPKAAAAPSGAPARPPAERGGPEPDIQDCERKMREWYKRGLRIERLKEALHKDWATLIRTFEEYERDIGRLELLRARLKELEGLGFDEELRRLGQSLHDPGAIREIESQSAELARRIMDRYTLKLPVTDHKSIAEAIRSLPLGIPSSLWGIQLETLVREYLSAERGAAPDGSVVVWLRGAWYSADPASPEFLNSFSGQVRPQKELFPKGAAERLEELLALLEGPEGRAGD